ncbi:MAG: class I SAM-dependent methyltransferase [Nanoarchaeota archaeon]
MEKENLIYDYWKKFTLSTSKPIKDWLSKENEFLKKNISYNSTVLDVGIGYGRNVDAIASNVKKLIGIDKLRLIPNEIKKITNKYSNVELFCEDANNMHFKDNTFDFVTCMGNTFGDFADHKLNILREMKRVCKKDGKIFVSVYSENATEYRIKEYKKIGIEISKIQNGNIFTSEGLKLEQFTKEKLKNIFNEVGLEVKIIELNQISYICVANK